MSEMAHIEQQVTINASAKKIFDTISNVDSAATLIPGIKITGHDGDTVLADFAVQLNGTSATLTARRRLRVRMESCGPGRGRAASVIIRRGGRPSCNGISAVFEGSSGKR